MELANLALAEGDTPLRTWQITQSDQILNLSGLTVVAIIKPSTAVADNAASAHQLTEGDGLTITDAATGRVQLSIPAAVTTSPGSWWYKIRVTSGPNTETAVGGWITIQDT